MIDFQQVANAALPHLESLCHEILPGGKVQGGRYHCAGIDGGKGESFCVWLNTGCWKDWADDTVKGGDAVSLVAAVRGISQGDAAEWLQSRYNTAVPVKVSKPKKESKAVPVNYPLPAIPTHLSGQPVSRHWTYDNAQGQCVGIVLRAESPEGKIVRPFVWDGKKWVSSGIPEPRPLYKLPMLLAKPDLPVLIVEGEPAADAAIIMTSGLLVTTWPNGANSFDKADLSPLEGRDLIIWPDNDEPGFKLVEKLSERFPNLRVVSLPDDLPEKWDLADAIGYEEWDSNRVMAMINEAKPLKSAPIESDAGMEPELKPFQCLGYDGPNFYILPASGGQVLSFTAPELTEANLITVAPMSYWFDTYGETKETKGGDVTVIKWSRARCDIVESCRHAGIYDADKVRGIGCWLEGKKVVIHTGDSLIYDGQKVPLSASTQFIYQKGKTLAEEADFDTLNDADAVKLLAVSKLIAFTNPMSALYLAGWCYIAPICGALHWRPHVWLVGKPGVGKSWVTENVISNCLGRFALRFRGGSTGPGIRQAIGRNALPSIGDDIESDIGASHAVQAIVAFARNCSSPGEAKVLKGTADQSGASFAAVSMFAANSVNVPHMETADLTRWTLLEMVKNTPERFVQLKAIAAETILDPFWCAGLRVRARRDAAILAANAKTFAKAIAARVGDSRAGDQLGTLLAGVYGLAKSVEVSDATAKAWVDAQDWQGATVDPEDAPEQACLLRLLDAKVRVETEPACERTVAECIEAIKGVGATMADLCRDSLARNGIRWDSGVMSVAVTHPFLSNVYRGTRWEHGTWGQDLLRMPGPEVTRKTNVRIGGVPRKCVLLSYD